MTRSSEEFLASIGQKIPRPPKKPASDVQIVDTDKRADSSERQDRYGKGRQPWDDIVELGWAPEFAAGNIVKYLRRNKEPEHSLSSARWYYQRLLGMAANEYLSAIIVLSDLAKLLTDEEKSQIGWGQPSPDGVNG